MKIKSVTFNNRKKTFEITVEKKSLALPYAKLDSISDSPVSIARVYIDHELGDEAFTYVQKNGEEGTVHLDSVLEYNQEPAYMQELFMYMLTLEVKKMLAAGTLSDRELSRRLNTSPAQFYRLLNEKNTSKSPFQMFELLRTLGCDVNLVIKKGRKRDVIAWSAAS